MANSAPGGTNDFNTKIIEEFRANEGRVSGPLAGATMILIHHIGAKAGASTGPPATEATSTSTSAYRPGSG
jgi:hypothetical protein